MDFSKGDKKGLFNWIKSHKLIVIGVIIVIVIIAGVLGGVLGKKSAIVPVVPTPINVVPTPTPTPEPVPVAPAVPSGDKLTSSLKAAIANAKATLVGYTVPSDATIEQLGSLASEYSKDVSYDDLVSDALANLQATDSTIDPVATKQALEALASQYVQDLTEIHSLRQEAESIVNTSIKSSLDKQLTDLVTSTYERDTANVQALVDKTRDYLARNTSTKDVQLQEEVAKYFITVNTLLNNTPSGITFTGTTPAGFTGADVQSLLDSRVAAKLTELRTAYQTALAQLAKLAQPAEYFINFSKPPIVGKKIKISLPPGQNRMDYLNLSKIQIYDSNNLMIPAGNIIATLDPPYFIPGYTAQNMIDPTITRYSSTANTGNAYMQFVLSSPIQLSRIVVINRPVLARDRILGYTLQIYDNSDNLVYNKIFDTVQDIYTFDLTAPATDVDIAPLLKQNANGMWTTIGGVLARRNANGDIECASYNATSCTSANANLLTNLANPASSDSINMKPLSCGKMHLDRWGITGYQEGNQATGGTETPFNGASGWCNQGLSQLPQQKAN